ncbi:MULTISPECIES: hypothetical protein [Cyanophyceae]|uniref:hypothetical protein n=1 Tax=Cyanophyceae TaxID=3028117 RepID=UPI001689B4AE|nr:MULTISPECIES: hypothetical protein [Cyanophyceae]MBD1915432.1 hypothetical protein [Phormidium sp. FACHB-77]MBD2028503.1 hypothetical protein [Phormidium sp. FACHB-322]MBD2051043.1 hypothetical protein [Leptolyngbya sp. FACHB-60]
MNTFFAAAMGWARHAAIALSCMVVLLTATPALANSSTPSNPKQGTAPLNSIYNEAEKAVQPENALNGDKMIDRANKGLNEVQKNADVNQMNTPANSGQATSPIDKIKAALSNMTK